MRKQLLRDHNFLKNSPIFIIESSTFNILAFQKALHTIYSNLKKIVLDLVKAFAAFEVGLNLDQGQGVYSGWADVDGSSQLRLCHKRIIDVMGSLVQIMSWCRPGDKPLFEPMMVILLTYVCVTGTQWVNGIDMCFNKYLISYEQTWLESMKLTRIIHEVLTQWNRFPRHWSLWESTSKQCIPHTKAGNMGFGVFFIVSLNKPLNKVGWPTIWNSLMVTAVLYSDNSPRRVTSEYTHNVYPSTMTS